MLNGDTEHPVGISAVDGGYEVRAGEQVYAVHSPWQPGSALLQGTLNGSRIGVQVERNEVGYRLTHAGAQVNVQVLSPRAAELSKFMLRAEPLDLSRFLLSPMPGLLVSVSAMPGREVKAGEALAVVEAMKMKTRFARCATPAWRQSWFLRVIAWR